ncbi:MAG: SDR family oxidoreductase [SAR324 cluster bacterium]|nr:SDR family oxidoreductase [SAR324 cluster bacterium]
MAPAVLITGASKRIGKALSLGMAQEGYKVLLHYRHSRQEAEETADAIEKIGSTCILFKSDLSDSLQMRELVRQAFEAAPECNVLINNASIFEENSLMNTSEAQFDQHFAINLKAPFFLTQGFARCCRSEGSVINLLDTRIKNNSSTHSAYSLSKKALYDFTLMAAKELAPRIRVNGISPGLILPPEGSGMDYLAEKSKKVPLQRYGDLNQIVQALRFLLSNSFITGDCLFLDGGEHLLHQTD